ncbi:hypothetical protein [Alistipes sp. An66]|uniref:hypothetical protein n=1 Tax=Alistipes sp. An66 TaxID=1965650 RepID=UPI0013A6616A|nr:hypothetical protein [Alistipes sp. An66]HIY15003.1 hypothetical protein [Candidatus Alistipes cottocaccae]
MRKKVWVFGLSSVIGSVGGFGGLGNLRIDAAVPVFRDSAMAANAETSFCRIAERRL